LDTCADGSPQQEPAFAQSLALRGGGFRDSWRSSDDWRFFEPDQSTRVGDIAFCCLGGFAKRIFYGSLRPVEMTAQSPATTSAAPSPWATVTFVVILIGVAVTIVRLGAGDVLKAADPALALWFDPGQSDARVKLAQSQWLRDEDNVDDAVTGAREALAYSPLSPAALTLLGKLSDHKGDQAKAAALMQWASRVDQRSIDAQIWLLNQDIKAARVSNALRRMDVLFRGQDVQVRQKLVPALAPILTSEGYQPGLIALLRTEPRWRPHFLAALAVGAKDLAGLGRLYEALGATDNPPTTDEWNSFLTRLVTEERFDEAYLAWSQSLPPERLSKLGYLYNANFQYTISNLAFDWVFVPVEGALARAETENGRRILDVDFFGGRVTFQNVSHLLSLPPGSYKFSGLERSQNLQNERGLRWRIACAGKNGATLRATELMAGDTPWREFDIDFGVPSDNCSYQNLVLELPARTAIETEIVGGASYANLEIAPK
jgi:hypothetical protein